MVIDFKRKQLEKLLDTKGVPVEHLAKFIEIRDKILSNGYEPFNPYKIVRV